MAMFVISVLKLILKSFTGMKKNVMSQLSQCHNEGKKLIKELHFWEKKDWSTTTNNKK